MLIDRFAPATEQAYRVRRTSQIGSFERLGAVAGAGAFLALVAWDAQVSRTGVGETVVVRIGVACVLLALLALTYTPIGSRHLALQSVANTAVISGFSWVLALLPDGFRVGAAGLAVAIVLMPLVAAELHHLVGWGVVALAAPNLFMAADGADRFTVVNANTWMAVSLAFAIGFWLVLDRVNRRLFLAEQDLAEERRRTDALLKTILPEEIAERLKRSGESVAARYDQVTILFADLVGFTSYARDHEPVEVVRRLNELFSAFDDAVAARGLEKIKTIGDGYMVAGGVPVVTADHATAVADLALEMIDLVAKFVAEHAVDWDVRIGVHSGEVVAGVIGKRKFAYDLWGDTVNVASRLESTGVPGRIQVSEDTVALLGPSYRCEPRGMIDLKNRGSLSTYFLEGRVASNSE
jgi:class 3 adenylate cyclase